MHLTLLIPELLWSEPADSEAWAGSIGTQLAKFLGSRRPEVSAPQAWEAVLAELAGLDRASSLAAMRAAGEAAPPFSDRVGSADTSFANHKAHLSSPGTRGTLLCADPVHLRFHQDRLILADAADLALSEDELADIETELNARLAPHRFRFTAPDRGYVRLGAPVGEAQRPLSQKVGCEVRPSDLGADPELRRLANEVQMLLHAHPANAAREAARQATVNALWLWGAGTDPTPVPPNARIGRFLAHGKDAVPLLRGFARHHDTEADSFTSDLHARMAQAASPAAQGTLVVSTALTRPAQYQDAAAWAAAWRDIDREVFSPALAALTAGRLSAVSIVAPTVFGCLRWSLSPWPARLSRWFPGNRPPLSSLAATLAQSPETTAP